jgi:serine protease Do
MGICVPLAQRPGELAGVEMYDCGVGFALPKHRLDEIVAHLKTGRSFYRGWLGIAIDPRSTDAVVIHNVADPSPMHAAGIKPGDKILGAAGSVVHHFGHLVQALYMIPAGEQVYLHLERDGREFGIAVTLARSADLGPLPDLEEPFDPANPLPMPDDE